MAAQPTSPKSGAADDVNPIPATNKKKSTRTACGWQFLSYLFFIIIFTFATWSQKGQQVCLLGVFIFMYVNMCVCMHAV